MLRVSDPLRSIRWSVLDRSRTREGEEPSRAPRDTVAFAQQAEELGFHRFWVAEHHSVPGEEARRMLAPEAWANAYSRTHGEFPPLVPVSRIEALTMTDRQRRIFDDSMRGHVHGTEEQVADELNRLLTRTRADEFLVHTSTYDRAARLDSHRRLASLAGLRTTC